MDLDSPDWDRSPSIIEDAQDDPYFTEEVKQEQIKDEQIKQEEPSPPESPHCKPLATNITGAHHTPPPPKAPPVLITPYRNLSTRPTQRLHPTTTPAPPCSKPPPPSPSSSTSSEDPVILTTNVPILQKSRPGQPSLHLRPQPTAQHPTPPLPSKAPPPPTPTHRQVRVTIPRPRLNQTNKVTTEKLKEAATRYGLPLARINRLTIKSLQHLVSIGAATAC